MSRFLSDTVGQEQRYFRDGKKEISMKLHAIQRGLTATLILGLTALAAPSVLAQHKHHSNTFSKIGHSIEYGVRKDAKNVSRATHRAIGHNSVERRNHGRHHYNRVLTSQGKIRPVHHKY